MKTLIFAILCLFTLNVYSSPPKNYKLAWADEFQGTELNKKNWKLGWPIRFGITNTFNNAEVYDGLLHIKVTTKDGKHFSSILTTEGILQEKIGYWEVKVKFADVPGTWSDAWLYTHKMHPERKGIELDIFEHRYYNWDQAIIPNLISYGIHYNGYGEESWTKGGSFELNHCQEWFVFGLLATKDSYIWFLDGEQVAEIKDTRDEPLFFILSTELQDWFWAGRLLDNYNNETMTVDYVRYYKEEERFKLELPLSTYIFLK